MIYLGKKELYLHFIFSIKKEIQIKYVFSNGIWSEQRNSLNSCKRGCRESTSGLRSESIKQIFTNNFGAKSNANLPIKCLQDINLRWVRNF